MKESMENPRGMKTVRRRVWMGVVVLALFAYALAYFGITTHGEYSQRMYSSGRYEWIPGIPARDIFIWMPAGVRRDKYESNFLGWFFAPAIWLDRKYFHRDWNIIDNALKDMDESNGEDAP